MRKNKFAISCRLWGTIFVTSSFLSLNPIEPAIAETELLKTLTVTGNGIEKIETTLAEVELGVEIRDKTASQVQQKVARRTSAVLDLLRSKNVEQLQTTGVILNPSYERSDRNAQQILVGYTGVNRLSFYIPIDRVGALLDEAVKAGVSRIDRVSFTATPEAIAAAKQEALRQASLNAQTQADVVLDNLNLTAEEIVNITIDSAGANQPQPVVRSQAAFDAESISTPIIGGEQTVRASVTLQISY